MVEKGKSAIDREPTIVKKGKYRLSWLRKGGVNTRGIAEMYPRNKRHRAEL